MAGLGALAEATGGGAPLLQTDFSADYPGKPGTLDGIRLRLSQGEILGLIGPSGCGKSTVALAVLRLLELRGGNVRGSICFDGRELMRLRPAELRDVRGRLISLVLQSPMSALNPALKIETQLREAWNAHSRQPWPHARERLLALLDDLGLPPQEGLLRRYPRQLSVGQAQRVVVAMAVMHGPRLLIADEPTSALDPQSQADIVALFARLRRQLGMSILYISHDLASVAQLCDNVAVLRAGRLVEHGPAADLVRRRIQAFSDVENAGAASLLA